MQRWVLAFKAEMVLGFHLVSRHRAPRFAGVLSVFFLVAVVAGRPFGVGMVSPWMALPVAGTFSAVAGSRLLAHGAALWAARSVCEAPAIAVAGRFAGGMVVIAPVAAVIAMAVTGPSHSSEPAIQIGFAVLFAAVMAGVTMAVTPALGASVASVVGMTTAWVGVLSSDAVAASSLWFWLSGWLPHTTVLTGFSPAQQTAVPAALVRSAAWLGITLGLATWLVSRQRPQHV